MLKKENRLRRIERNRSQNIFSSPIANIRVSEGEGESKFGFVVSKKISKKAVIRNRTKRILRAFVENNLERIKTGKNFVFVSKKELDFSDKEEIFKDLEETLKKAKLWREE